MRIKLKACVCGRTEKGRENHRGKCISKSRLRKNIECHYCHKFRQYKKIILSSKRKNVRRKSQDEKSSVVSIAEVASTSHEILSVAIFNACSRDEWILDSDCSYHICPYRDWLVTYQPIDYGNVLMGNTYPARQSILVQSRLRYTTILLEHWAMFGMCQIWKKIIFFGHPWLQWI